MHARVELKSRRAEGGFRATTAASVQTEGRFVETEGRSASAIGGFAAAEGRFVLAIGRLGLEEGRLRRQNDGLHAKCAAHTPAHARLLSSLVRRT